MQSRDHWERVYTTKAPTGVSWFQEHARQSVELIRQTGVTKDAEIIDVGGGASTLIDDLIGEGYLNLTVLDLSEAALSAARSRLGARANRVAWMAGDITQIELPVHAYDVWHDRAVFHFLTAKEERDAYVRTVLRAVKPGGSVIVATFAEDGPDHCSGLPVVRYSADALHDEFGAPFTLLKQEREEHHTPFGTVQKFIYCLCRKEAD
ncbi:class I SAM-dependent methyltransferase [Paraburkholderia dinghuensis]|uniref:Class I SAM-dependent methyltransferase n=1 Tax=Paraburkholderia dinghuensis TaxID=2305225 RepID=A0A3N6NKP3_9BURK|nr:class I SAM-dependent methyltransferase [Paraburkholderia dinghuensis]RQG99842.1 class I SAM-dependent methyltransferase [Paraburkholderia dinghuensis]